MAPKSFDYIVIGGGTAGLTIASRLAEDPSITVAVIEAGGRAQVAAPFISSIPGADVLFVGAKEVLRPTDWGFHVEPDEASAGKKRSYARGKCLGGSSARNFMIYQRPTKQALDRWALEVDDPSYSFTSFLPFYKRSPHFTPPGPKRSNIPTTMYDTSAFDMASGPLQVSYPNYPQPFSLHMEKALNEIGIPSVTDFNSGTLLGCQYCSTTIDPSNQHRSSSQTAFLPHGRSKQKNLTVITRTMAKQIIFNHEKKAIGVLVSKRGRTGYLLAVKKEIIVSAGAFQSPQLLMLSGIGPQRHLEELGIEVVAHRPGVGQNLQDHIFFGPSYRVSVDTLTRLANWQKPRYLVAQLLNYLKGEGPLTNNVADFLGWEKIPEHMRSFFSIQTQDDLNSFPADWPEVEYLSGAGFVGDWDGLLLKQPKDEYQYATILAALVAPLSRGTVTLKSAEVKDLPIIKPGYLTSQTDQIVAIAAYKRVREAFASSSMQEIVIGPEYFPGDVVQSDDQILETIKESLQTVWHASCTCKMGKSNDEMAVIDSQARVYGVKGVRVVDASSFPFLPPGHPQSTVYALAEKIASLIKNVGNAG